MKIVVIGGTGLIGSKLVAVLRQRGQEVLAASPDSGVNTLTGEGLAEALAGAQVVVDLDELAFVRRRGGHEFLRDVGSQSACRRSGCWRAPSRSTLYRRHGPAAG